MTPIGVEAGQEQPQAANGVETGFCGIFRNRTWKWLALLVFGGVLPFGIWLIGTAMTWVTPPSYQSFALVRVAPGSLPAEEVAAGMRSGAVMKEAARLLAVDTGNHPMSEYLLSTSLSVEPKAGPDMLRLEARSDNAGGAQLMVAAVMEAYALVHPGSPANCVYIEPTEKTPDRVSDEVRMALGLGGLAGLGLLLAIPLLEGVERAMPLRRVSGSEGLKA